MRSLAPTLCHLTLDEIRRDGGTQPRAAIDLKHVKLLEEQMEDGKELEPITVFYDGESHWLADGYHRWHAHHNQGQEAIACVIHQGSCRDAVLYSVGANADHKPALPRSREDKRQAVMTLLHDPEWSKWSDREIAQHCKVHHNTVGKIRADLTGDLSSEPRIYITKHGTVAQMNTANIGKKSQKAIPQLESDWSDDNVQRHPPLPSRVTVTDDHPLFLGQSGTITQLPNPDSAIVELETGERELISVEYLQPTVAHHLKLSEGGLVEVSTPDNNKIDGRQGRIASVHERTVEVWLRDVDTMTMQKHTLKHQQVTPLPLEQEPQLCAVCDRLTKLRSCELDPFEVQILALYDQPVAFTPVELEYLAHIEQRHGIAIRQVN
jgi:uncharacterized ParB-like nuclease family protein